MTSLNDSEESTNKHSIYDNYERFEEQQDKIDTRNGCVHEIETPNIFLGFGLFRDIKQWSALSFDPVTAFKAVHAHLPFRNFAAVINVGSGETFIVGGEDHESCVLSLSRNLTRRLPSLNVPRTRHCVCIVDDAVIVCGGSILYQALKSCEVFSRAENIWRMLPDMNGYRSDAAAIAVSDRRIVVLGGFNGQVRLASVEVFRLPADLSTLSTGEHMWTRFPSLREARSHPLAVLYEDNIIVMGGTDYQDSIEIFSMHEGEGQWVSLGTNFHEFGYVHSLIATPDFLYAFVDNYHDSCFVEQRQWRRIRNPEMWTSARSPEDIFTSDLWTQMPQMPSTYSFDRVVNAPSYYSHIYI